MQAGRGGRRQRREVARGRGPAAGAATSGAAVARDAELGDPVESLAQRCGIDTVRRALEAPLQRIARNASAEAAPILERVSAGEVEEGYNLAAERFGDMFAMGVIDPTKVTCLRLPHAASVAAPILTTDCVVGEKPAPAAAAAQAG
jgi:chaperonin GroEL